MRRGRENVVAVKVLDRTMGGRWQRVKLITTKPWGRSLGRHSFRGGGLPPAPPIQRPLKMAARRLDRKERDVHFDS
jgi:hypothetical protein